VLYLFIGTVY